MWFYSFDVTDKQVAEIGSFDNVVVQHYLAQLETLSLYHTRHHDPSKAAFQVRGCGSSARIPVLVGRIQSIFQEVTFARES